MMPTICELTGAEIPAGTDGISFLPELTGRRQPRHSHLYWEFPEYGGQQSVIIGNMKAIRKQMHKGNETFELYDLSADPSETRDIAHEHPEIIARVKEIISKEHLTSSNPGWRFSLLDE
jgi:arylsulfatase